MPRQSIGRNSHMLAEQAHVGACRITIAGSLMRQIFSQSTGPVTSASRWSFGQPCLVVNAPPGSEANLLLVTLLIPPFAIALGVLFLGEWMGPEAWIGFAIIALGFAVTDGRLFSRIMGKASR